MAICSWHHTYKVVYTTKENNGFSSSRKVDFVEAAMEGLARQQVIEAHGGPLKCSVWSVQQID